MSTSGRSPQFCKLLQDFFAQNLISQRNVSPRTVIAYRDTFRLLLKYASDQQHKPPAELGLTDRRLYLTFHGGRERKWN